MRRGKFGLFCACDQYPDCKTTFSVPKGALIKATKNICVHCKHPKISIIKQGKRPQEICINPSCESKSIDDKLLKQKKKCPKCNAKLVVKKGLYGAFWACSAYPKCKYVENINNKKVKIEKATVK